MKSESETKSSTKSSNLLNLSKPQFDFQAIAFSADLPVNAKKEFIVQAFQSHQVIVICGETGSGKTTQLPKLALSLGRGQHRMIGHTQPRRIAAVSVAKRIAQELNTPLGEIVGYQVRFQSCLHASAKVKLMTEGILLAEIQSDPLLKTYDTLIIDEAHERSLNIDFLLGYLKKILPRRPDLKVVITSATIDADRFARHFAPSSEPEGPFAPVLTVTGRMYPVEQYWRPFEETRDQGFNEAVIQSIEELWRKGPGDILIFLPGEREIRNLTTHLRGAMHGELSKFPSLEVLPLFSRLSQQEQERIFKPSQGRRIVLATNVAETSLTVPGIRYVIDSGLARVKRYSYRNKVEQLQIEKISQAAANQRAGRCGRVANGICIRLFDESDFLQRPAFNDPEILRSSLAGVILKMKALGLGGVEEFPFLEPPSGKAIADGYGLLSELNAIDARNELTPIGMELAKLPLDPRIGRLILEARNRECLSEILIIASALSLQDVRDRPLEQQQLADEKHKQFNDEKSEFLSYLKIWNWVEAGRGRSSRLSEADEESKHKLSNRQQEARLRENFISARRVREWRDIHGQLQQIATEHGWRQNKSAATYEQIHLSLLAGLLGNIGFKNNEQEGYLGARGIRFWPHPGTALAKKPGAWVVAAELIDTTRLCGRGLASIDPKWLVQVGEHLLKKQILSPHWEKKSAEVVAFERATLHGIVVYSNRRVNFGRIDPKAAREIFIREALVNGQWETRLPFLSHNQNLVRQIEDLEHKSRRQDVLIDDALIYAYYDQHLPADVVGGVSLEHWFKHKVKESPNLLMLERDALMRHEAAGITTSAFPKTLRLGGVDCAVSYLHQPGEAKDGVTAMVPIYVLNQLREEACDWLVAGMLEAKVLALLKSLPPKLRSRLAPLPAFSAEFCEIATTLRQQHPNLLAAVAAHIHEKTRFVVQRQDFKLDQMPVHLSMNFCVVSEHGALLGMGRNLQRLKEEFGGQARSAFQALAVLKTPKASKILEVVSNASSLSSDLGSPKMPMVWDLRAVPPSMDMAASDQPQELRVKGFPALVDRGNGVELQVFDEFDVAAQHHQEGLRRLVMLNNKEALKYLEKNMPDLQPMTLAYMSLGTQSDLREQLVALSIDRAFLLPPLPESKESFEVRMREGRPRLNLIAQEISRLIATILGEYSAISRKLKDSKPPKEVLDDMRQQLQQLMPKNFIAATPWPQLQHYPRYLKAMGMRLEKIRTDGTLRDSQRLAELRPLEQRYWKKIAQLKGKQDQGLQDYRWLLEELRVGFFAQTLKTPQPVSVKRLEKVWAQLMH